MDLSYVGTDFWQRKVHLQSGEQLSLHFLYLQWEQKVHHAWDCILVLLFLDQCALIQRCLPGKKK